jgi:hypothetical protein
MRLSSRAVASAAVVAAALALVAARDVAAADPQKIADQIDARNRAASAAYAAGDLDKMKAQLAKAVAMGEESGLTTSPALARAYLLTGVLQVDGNEDAAAGVRYFAKALRVKADVEVPTGMATKAVMSAFKQALAESVAAPADGDAPPPKADRRAAARDERRDADARAARDERARQEADKQEADRQLGEAKGRAQALEKEGAERDKQLADGKERERKLRDGVEKLQEEKAERERQLSEAKGRVQSLERDKAERDKQLAEGKERERKQAEAVEKLQAEKTERERKEHELVVKVQAERADREKQIADLKTRVLSLEKDKADRDKQLAEVRGRAQQLEKDKADRDKQLAEVRGRAQQLEKDKADRDRQLAALGAKEKKQREDIDNLAKEKQWADTRDKDRQLREEQDRQQREKLAEGPDLPARLAEPLVCNVPDEAPSGADLYVHCAARPNVKAKAVALYYRASGVAHFNSLEMDRSRKGWYVTAVPGAKVSGRLLQYYVEARNGEDDVVATNGKAGSPNVVTLRAATAAVAAPKRPR